MTQPIIELTGLRKSFGGVVVAADINLSIVPGRVDGVIGPNGAGKTSLFNLISGSVKPDAGTIRIGGKDVSGMPVHERAQAGVSRTFQDVRLFESLSVIENLLVGAPEFPAGSMFGAIVSPGRTRRAVESAKAKALDTLELVGLAEEAHTNVVSLPYGMQKLVAISRALMNGGKCLLLDEPMAGVEGHTYGVIQNAVRAVAARGLGVCVIEHNVSFIEDLCDHAYFMNFGRVIAEGTVKELTARDDLSEMYFGKAVGV